MTTNNPQCGRPTSKNKPCKNPTITWPEPIPTCLQHQTTQERETRPTPGPHGAEPPVRSHPMTCHHTLEAFYDNAGNLGHRCSECHVGIDLRYRRYDEPTDNEPAPICTCNPRHQCGTPDNELPPAA